MMERVTGGFLPSILGAAFGLLVLSSGPQLRQTSAASTAHDGSDDTATEVSDRTHYRTGGAMAQPLRIAAVEVDPFFSKQLTPSGESYSGYLVDVVEELSRIVPFQVEWVVVDNGRKRKHGNSWMELTGKLLNGTVNVSVLPIDASNAVEVRRFSHTHPFLRSTLSLVARSPASVQSANAGPWLLENLINASDHSRPEFGVSSETLAHHLWTSNLSLYRQIWNDLSPSEVLVSMEEGLRKVRQGDFVLITESMEATYHASREPCDLLAHDQSTHEIGYVFAAQRNSSIVRMLNDALERFRERGVLAELYDRWWVTDECTRRRGDAERDDSDLDMERIFFTSPIKFFKSRVLPEPDTPDSTRSGSLVTAREPTQPDNVGVNVPATVTNKPDTLDDFNHGRVNTGDGHAWRSSDTAWHRRRERTTLAPLSSTPRPPSFEVRVQTDPEIQRKSRRGSRTPRQQAMTTLPLRAQVAPTRTSPPFHRVSPGHSRGTVSDGRDAVRSSSHHHQRPAGYTVAPPAPSKATRPSWDVERDFEWVFVTQQPRLDAEYDYDGDDYDDDNDDSDYHEQRVTIRVSVTKQKDPVITRVLNSKETVAKSEAKPIRKSSVKSSSSNPSHEIDCLSMTLALFLASTVLLMSIRSV